MHVFAAVSEEYTRSPDNEDACQDIASQISQRAKNMKTIHNVTPVIVMDGANYPGKAAEDAR